MTDLEQIRAISELDGWTDFVESSWDGLPAATPREWSGSRYQPLPDYLHSRDAIIPVIEKQPIPVRQKIIDFFVDDDRTFGSIWDFATASDRRLCEALLRATGKWV